MIYILAADVMLLLSGFSTSTSTVLLDRPSMLVAMSYGGPRYLS